MPWSIRLTFRIAMAGCWCYPACSACILFCSSCLPTRATRATVPIGRGKGHAATVDRDRETIRSGEGLRGPSEAVGRGTDAGLVEPLPPAGQGLREPDPNRPGVRAPRLDPPHAEKDLQSHVDFPDRLLGVRAPADAKNTAITFEGAMP